MAGNVLFIKDYFKLQNNTYPVLAVSIHQQDKCESVTKSFYTLGLFYRAIDSQHQCFFLKSLRT